MTIDYDFKIEVHDLDAMADQALFGCELDQPAFVGPLCRQLNEDGELYWCMSVVALPIGCCTPYSTGIGREYVIDLAWLAPSAIEAADVAGFNVPSIFVINHADAVTRDQAEVMRRRFHGRLNRRFRRAVLCATELQMARRAARRWPSEYASNWVEHIEARAEFARR